MTPRLVQLRSAHNAPRRRLAQGPICEVSAGIPPSGGEVPVCSGVVEDVHRASAERMCVLLASSEVSAAGFRAALESVPPAERDAWLDVVLGLDAVAVDDGPELPQGCVPYLPCSVDALLRMVEQAGVQASDVFVDVGSGVGRAAVLVHLLTGAAALGIEVQATLVLASRELASRVNASRFAVVKGDAAQLAGPLMIGSIFFLYCPFSGTRLEKVLDDLEAVARTRQIRVCCVDLPLPPRPWLTLVSPPEHDLAVYRSNCLADRDVDVVGPLR